MSNEPVIRLNHVSIGFENEERCVAITDDVSLELFPGEVLGLVGESGCGKTVTALSILRLLPVPKGRVLSGEIYFQGKDILQMTQQQVQAMRGAEISMIFQEPSMAMNPLMTIGKQLLECFEYHPFEGNPQQRVLELIEKVGIPDSTRILKAYPHELSGGMIQRVMIAMALLLKPKVVIADEPTTALDVTVQAQIMNLLVELQEETGTAIILITHNLGLIAQYAHRLAVMYAGRIVEVSEVEGFLERPLHPYSQGLLRSIPDLSKESRDLQAIPGQVPKPEAFVQGCRFQDRCSHALDKCQEKPKIHEIQGSYTACWLYEETSDPV